MSWRAVRQLILDDPMLRMHAAVLPTATARPEPVHPDATGEWFAVTGGLLRRDAALASTVFDRPTASGSTGVATLLEHFVRPLIRVFRVSLEVYGWPLVDLARDSVAFELSRDRGATGRVLLAVLPGSSAPGSRLTVIDTLVSAFAQVHRGPVRHLVDEVIAAELRYLRPATADMLASEPRWAPYVHSVPSEQEATLERVVQEVRSRAAAHRVDRDTAAPVVRVAHRGAGELAGLARFGREIFHFGAELRVVRPDAADPEPDVAVGLDTPVRTFERAPRTWREPSSRAPHLSRATSMAGLRLAELRANPLGDRFAVRWGATETAAFIARLVDAADRAADRAAEKALTAHGTEPSYRLIHDVLQRDQFRAGRRSDYSLDDARADLLPAMAGAGELHVALLIFPNKFAHSGLKAAGLLPDLAELGMLARVAELIGALRRVHPPGVRFTLLSDGEHFRPHPHARLDAGMAKLREYAHAIAGDAVEIADLDAAAARSMTEAALAAHTERRAAALARYERLLGHLDIAADPVGVLREVAALDPHRTVAETFRSVLHSVPVPAGVDARTVYDDIYDVGPGVDPAVRWARQEVLRTTWHDVLIYTATYQADYAVDFRRQVLPGALWLTTRPRQGRAGFRPLGHGPTPAHGTGVVDARGIIATDFLVSLRDQGFVPLYSPLLGAAQPFAMVPVTATRVGASGASELDPDFAAGIRLRPR
jgi:hypothetical protein